MSKNGLQPLPPIYTYTFEAPTGAVHVSWTLHIPEAMREEFELKLPQWVDKATGDLHPFDISVKPITPDTDKRVANYCNEQSLKQLLIISAKTETHRKIADLITWLETGRVIESVTLSQTGC